MSLEHHIENKNTSHKRAFFVAACGSIALLATITGCDEEPSQPNYPTISTFDRDNDGILNYNDKWPDRADPIDVDNDGLANADDLHPYDASNGKISIPPLASPSPRTTPQNIPQVPSNPQPCVRNAKPDRDADGIPDYCDAVFDSKDSDNDGLYDYEDSAPYTADRDNDGIPDGQDREPNVNQKREEEKRDAERREQERLEEQRRQRERDGY